MAPQNTPNSGDSRVVQLRIERGAVAEATDGPVGTIEQIVVDRTTGQVSALVIRASDNDTEFELPARYIDVAESTGDHVRLELSRRDFTSNPEMARPYNPEQYTPVYQGEAMPESAANRMAAESDRPVVTDVEANAAGLAVSEPGPASPGDAMTTASATSTPTDTAARRRSDTAAQEDVTPTVKLNTAQPSTGEAIAGEQRTAPAPETSATPATTGALMGGKPSTSGMGEKASVPTSPAPALDTIPTSTDLPPYTNQGERGAALATSPATPNLAPETDALQMEPPTATPVGSSAQPASQADVNVGSAGSEGGSPANEAPEPFPASAQATPESVAPPDPALGSGEVPVLAETAISPTAYEPPMAETTETTPAQPQMLDQLKERVPGLLASLGRSPALLLAVGGLTAGIVAGIALRRRDGAGARMQRTARQATDQAGAATQQARDVVSQLARSAQEALRSAGETAQAKAQDAQAQLPGGNKQLTQQAKETAAQVKAAAAQTREQAREQAKETARQAQRNAQKSAKRTARRFRWFRRGLVVGGAVSMLFAPQPGSELRSRIGAAVEDWRSRMSRTA